MKRRDFIRTTGAAAAFVAAGCASRTSDQPVLPSMKTIGSLGLQLYTVRSLMDQGVAETLTKVAAAGYREVEFAGYFGHEAAAIKGMLEERGLSSPSTHVSIEALEESPAEQFAFANAIGQRYVVVPWLSPEYRSVDGYKSSCARLNALGERARDAGLQIAYHNHDFEFEEVDGTVAYDLMLDELNPDLVKMQLDLYWIFAAGKSAPEYLARDRERYVSCHIKDGTADRTQTVIGAGEVDLAAAFRAGDFKHYFVENDQPEDAEDFIVKSAHYLSTFEY